MSTPQPAPPKATPLSPAEVKLLDARGWQQRVGDGLGVWVSIPRQRFYIVQGGQCLWTVPCATATNGPGNREGTQRTPTGWHKVAEKFGEGAKWGQVFRSRQATKEVWTPGMDTKEDLVLTRILWLEGLEPGRNQGRAEDGANGDSRKRYIYIHGTNGEDKIGQPSSHGCIRLRNDDVITAFEAIATGTPILITE